MALPYQDSSPPKVWILILHWRGVDFTRKCLISLKENTYQDCKTLLVDNGSAEFDGAVITAEFPHLEVIRLDSNRGFAGGCNAGINACLQQNADFIWLLNNDTRVEPDTLTKLVEEAQRNPKAGALAAVVVEELASQKATISAGRGEIDFKKGKTYLRNDLPPDTVDCQWVCGANLLLRAEAIKGTGAFDEDYFLYFEDTELCHRMRLAGWQCLLVPKARIEHVGGASTPGRRKHWRSYYHTRNRFKFFAKYTPKLLLPLAFVFMLGHVLRHAFVLPFRGNDGRDQLRAELLGLRDFIDGVRGKARCLDWCER